MPRKRVLIISDSRGRGLEPYLREHLDHDKIIVQVEVLPGANLEKAVTLLERKFDESTDLAIISAGICNFTRKEKQKGRKVLSYSTNQDNIQAIQDLITKTSGKYRDSLIITTIPPASLTRYYKHYNDNEEPPEELIAQQTDLLADIEAINQLITTLNKADNRTNIDLHTKCFTSALDPKKKREQNPLRRRKIFQEKLLTDGVHPNQTLQHRRFSRFLNVISAWLAYQSYSDTDHEGAEEWDYKRQRFPRPSTSSHP